MSDLYMPIEARREVIKQYARAYQIRVFVETGTADASTTQALVPYFDDLYTIEIDEGLYNRARLIFETASKVHCFLGDSGFVLPKVLDLVNEAAIFWLDGHYCGGPTRGTVDSPVIQELETCLPGAPTDSVILIDDARIFGGGAEEGLEGYTGYPHLSWVEEMASTHGFNYFLADDIIRLTPAHPERLLSCG